MHDHHFGYRVCDGCGVAVRARELLARAHDCLPDRYLAHQVRRLHWRRAGFDDALRGWLETPAGRSAQAYARLRVQGS
jgi:hypothetical protein